MNSNIEKENIFERQHSCKWYFDELTETYDEYFDETGSNSAITNTCKILQTGDAPRKIYPQLVLSFGLFVKSGESVNWDDKTEDERECYFDQQKFLICKKLNTIDSIIEKICNKNAVNAIYDIDKKIVNVKTVLTWLYVYSTKATDKHIGDINRVKSILNQIYKLAGIPFDANTVTKNVDGLAEKDLVGLLDKNKAALASMIEKISTVYDSLAGFKKYAVPYRMTTPQMHIFNIWKPVALASAMESVFLTIFAAYSKIPELQLPRSEFMGAVLMHSNVSDSNFANSDFSDSDMCNSYARNCDFSSCKMENCKAMCADFAGSTFSYANLIGADFENAILDGVKLDEVALQDNSPEIVIMKDHVEPFDDMYTANSNEDKMRSSFTEARKTARRHDSNVFHGDDFRKSFMNALGKGAAHSEYGELCKSKDDGFEFATKMEEICSKYDDDTAVKLLVQYQAAISISPELTAALVKACKDSNLVASDRKVKLNRVSAKRALLSKADMSLIDMSDADFEDSDMNGASIAYGSAQNAYFGNANFSKTNSYKTDYSGASFFGANVGKSVFIDNNMSSVSLVKANLFDAIIMNSKSIDFIKQTVSDECKHYTSLNESCPLAISESRAENTAESNDEANSLLNSNWNGAVANQIFLGCLNLSKSSFESAIFKGAVIFDCKAHATSWQFSDLTFCAVLGFSAQRSSFSKANFQESKLFACDFTCCNLSGTSFIAALLDRVLFHDSNLRSMNLAHSTVCNSTFRDSEFDNVVVSNATFKNCIFIKIDFTNCVGIHSATFENCVFVECFSNDKKIELQFAPPNVSLVLRKDSHGTVMLRGKADDALGVFAKLSNSNSVTSGAGTQK